MPGELTLTELRRRLTDDDGVLPDGIVEDSTAQEWTSLLSVIRARGWRAQWLGSASPEVEDEDERFAEAGTLAVWPVPGVQINFFTGADVVFDFDRREVSDEQGAAALGAFLRDLGTGLAREITLTYEGSATGFLRYHPGSDRFDWLL